MSDVPAETPPEAPPANGGAAEGEEEKKKRGFPHPLTFLGIIILAVWIMTFFIPSGEYQIDDEGRPIPSSFQEIDSPLDFGEKVENLLLSPINGLYGIQDLETGEVGPFNAGVLFGGAQVFLFILAIGAFMTVVFATGALDLGIARLAHRFRAQGTVLIIVMCLLFGVLGSVMTWSDETLGFYALMIPLMLSLGYDKMVTVAVVTVAPFVGAIGSTVTPFRIGIGSDAAGISIGDGIGLRVVMFVLVMAAMILYTLRYAKRVKADPSRSLVPAGAADTEHVHTEAGEPEPMSGRAKVIIGLVVFTFVLLTFSIIPWGSILNNTLVDPYTHETLVNPYSWELGWWLPELSALFVVMAIVVGVVGRLGEAGTAQAIIKGIVDFTGPAIIVPVALAVSVILTNTKTLDTVLNAMEGFVSGTSSAAFTMILAAVSLPLGFLVGSGSAGQALTMPILAPLADFADIDRSLVVTTYNAMGAWLNLVLPINAILVAGLALAKVPFDRYIKFMVPLMGILLVIIIALLLIGVAF